MNEMEDLLEQILGDSVMNCQKCGYGPLEPDFDECPECGAKNPVKEMGLI